MLVEILSSFSSCSSLLPCFFSRSFVSFTGFHENLGWILYSTACAPGGCPFSLSLAYMLQLACRVLRLLHGFWLSVQLTFSSKGSLSDIFTVRSPAPSDSIRWRGSSWWSLGFAEVRHGANCLLTLFGGFATAGGATLMELSTSTRPKREFTLPSLEERQGPQWVKSC